MLLFFCPFIAVGIFGIVMTWKKTRLAPPVISRRHPRASASPSFRDRAGRATVGLVFFGLGASFFYFMTVAPWQMKWQSAAWTVTPCTVGSATLEPQTRPDSNLDARFHYVVNGASYDGDRYDFSGDTCSCKWTKYPAGSQHVCYVNPQDPEDSVFQRTVGYGTWFGILGLLFACIGVGCLVAAQHPVPEPA